MARQTNRFFLFCVFTLIIVFPACNRDNCKKDIYEKVYVANEDGGTVSVIDARTYEILKTVDLKFRGEMYMAHNLQVAPDNQSVWVTGVPMHGHGDELVIVIKGKRDKDKEHINMGEEQHLAHVVLDETSRYAYVSANSPGQIIKIDSDKMKEVQRFDLGAGTGPHGMRYMDGKLYIACMTSKEMIILDITSSAQVHVPMGGIVVQTAVLPGIGSVFASVYDLKEVVRYDVLTGDTTRIPLPAGSQGPIQLYPSPDNQRVYVCDQGIVNGNPSSNKLYVINTSSNTVVSTITVGNGAHGVTVSTDGTKIFVTNLEDNTVSVVDATSLSVLKTISVGDTPNGISFLDCD